MAFHIKSDGTIVEVEPKQGKRFTLEELRDFVDGYIELVPVRPGRYGLITVDKSDVMFCNEEGKLKGFAQNTTASVISQYFPRDVIVGNVLICKRKQVD